jgi:hypothetical protein
MDTDTEPKPPVDRIVDKFGGLTAMAKALGHKNPTTVQGWRLRGSIPSRQIPAVIEAGKSLEAPVHLTPADFFEIPDDPSSGEEDADETRAEQSAPKQAHAA